MIPFDLIAALPQTYRATIPESYLDEMGHMNIQWYLHLFDRAAWGAFGLFGASLAHMEATQTGVFALEQHIRYLAEVRVGQTIRVHTRFLARSPKRLHFMHFMLNEERQTLSATLEALGMSMNMATRKSGPWSDELGAKMDEWLALHQKLEWEAPLCGVMKP